MPKRGDAKPFSTRHLLLYYLPFRVGGILAFSIILLAFNGPTAGPIALFLLTAIWGVSTVVTYKKCWAIHDRLISRPGSNYEQFYRAALAENRINTLIDGHYAIVKREFRNWLPD